MDEEIKSFSRQNMLGKKENEILLGIIWLSKSGSSAQHNRREGTSNN